MKKSILCILTIIVLAAALSGCGGKSIKKLFQDVDELATDKSLMEYRED